MDRRTCINCVFGSESYPSLKDYCDWDGHRILDADNERCEKFAAAEGTEVAEDGSNSKG